MQEATVAEMQPKIFADVSEVEITRAIAEEFHEVLMDRASSDVIVIGAGPAGLTASRDLSNMGFKVLVIEQNNYLGGGYWLGGYMMNPVKRYGTSLEFPTKRPVKASTSHPAPMQFQS